MFGSCLHCHHIKHICNSYSVPCHWLLMVWMLECPLPTLSICSDGFVRGVENEPNDFALIISLAPSGKTQRELYCYLIQSSETEEDRKGGGTPRILPFPARTNMGLILSLHAVTSCRLNKGQQIKMQKFWMKGLRLENKMVLKLRRWNTVRLDCETMKVDTKIKQM